MKHPDKFDFIIESNEVYKPLPTKTITVDTTIVDLADFAKNQGINYKILKLHNPWLRDKKLEVSANKKYQIQIPLEGY